jgi:FMN phosphatase YigB (HAD superfamily)
MATDDRIIVVDLDGTLCNCDHRIEFAHAKDWDGFHSRLREDKPYMDVVDIVMRLATKLRVYVVSGRSAKYEEETRRWLKKHGIIVDVLILRPEFDFTPDHELKAALLYEQFEGGKAEALEKVIMVLDDREKVVEAWRNEGFACWQVRQGQY